MVQSEKLYTIYYNLKCVHSLLTIIKHSFTKKGEIIKTHNELIKKRHNEEKWRHNGEKLLRDIFEQVHSLIYI